MNAHRLHIHFANLLLLLQIILLFSCQPDCHYLFSSCFFFKFLITYLLIFSALFSMYQMNFYFYFDFCSFSQISASISIFSAFILSVFISFHPVFFAQHVIYFIGISSFYSLIYVFLNLH